MRNENSANIFLCSDVLQLPFKRDTFDIILSVSTLDHFEKKEKFLKSMNELLRVLKSGGKFAASFLFVTIIKK